MNALLLQKFSEKKHENNLGQSSNTARKGLKNQNNDATRNKKSISSFDNSSDFSSLYSDSIASRGLEKSTHSRKVKHRDEIQRELKKIKTLYI